jgi:hypothetical protein
VMRVPMGIVMGHPLKVTPKGLGGRIWSLGSQ